MRPEDDKTCDVHLELTLVSECLRRHERFVARGLTSADFTVLLHQEVIKASQRLWEAGKPVGVESVALELQRAGMAPDGGLRRIAELASQSPLVADHERLRHLRRLRSVAEVVTLALGRVREGNLAGALSALAEVDQLGNAADSQRLGSETVLRLLEAKADAKEAARRYVDLGTGRLRDALGRIGVGSLMVIAADSNTGKSWVALGLVVAYARQGGTAGFISMEDPEDLTASRYLSCFAEGLSSREIHRDEYADERAAADAYARIGRAVEAIRRHDTIVFDTLVGQTDLDVMASMSRMAARGARLIVVDYLQEIGSSEPQQDRRNEIRVIAKRLKAHAIRLGVVLVLVSQIARPKDGATNTKPSKHSLKESGDVTNAAEVILVLWREQEDDYAPVRISIAKSKWGGVGTEWQMIRDRMTGLLREV